MPSGAPWVPRVDMDFSVYPSRLPFSVFFPSSCSVNSPYAASATEQLSRRGCQPCRRTLTRSSGARGPVINHSAPCKPLVPSLLLQPPLNTSWKHKWAGERQAAGAWFLQGVHVARRPAGGTGGDRCHGGPDLFLQEECKELIVSLPGSSLSMALPCLVERTPSLCMSIVGGQLWEGRGRLFWAWISSKPVPQSKFYSGS